ncbi:aspartic peptidase domain-containing protein [Mycena rosella]|uniref:Aspartic peptidase domain-containing protein n=1 Tax=Mycena rosella TaxID=1033263 RepID=A0AAD7DNJ1_MYCRO|nr:aspartic peptidase domain-containing protein [Mycena rosella]
MRLQSFLLLLNGSAAAFASASSVVFQSTVPAADPLHFPLARRTGRPTSYLGSAERARARYGVSGSGTPPRRHMISRQDMELVAQGGDTIYLLDIRIGTPPQTVSLMIDTGYADVWVAQSPCSNCPGSSTLYDSTASSTFSHNTTNITTITDGNNDEVSGIVARETFQIGSYTVTSQEFLQVNNLTGGTLLGSEAGELGLAFSALASTTKSTLWQAAMTQGAVPEMSFWLKRGAPNEGLGGIFTFGGTNASLFTGEIEFQDLAAPPTGGFWQLNVSAITVQGKAVTIASNAGVSIIDVGTTLIGGPANYVNAIWAAIPGSKPATDMPRFYQFPCNTTVNVTVSFGGKAWPINPVDINLGTTSASDGACLGAIFVISETDAPLWVFGITFLASIFTPGCHTCSYLLRQMYTLCSARPRHLSDSQTWQVTNVRWQCSDHCIRTNSLSKLAAVHQNQHLPVPPNRVPHLLRYPLRHPPVALPPRE